MKKSTIFAILVTVIEIAVIIYFWGSLPEKIPSHWNMYNEVDGYAGKWVMFLAPALNLLIAFLMVYPIQFIKEVEKKQQIQSVIYKLIPWLVSFFAVIFARTLATSLGMMINVGAFIMLATGVLFIPLGLLMPKLPQNYWAGVRLPATLENKEVWEKTNKKGGNMFSMLGGAFIASSFIAHPLNFIIPMGFLIIGLIYLVVYSHVLYKKVNEKK